jgi:hypothetical protein
MPLRVLDDVRMFGLFALFPNLLPGSPGADWLGSTLLLILTPRASVVAGAGTAMTL